MKIVFNVPAVCANELENLEMVIQAKKFSGNGEFTKKCHKFFTDLYKIPNLLTTSCTDALEMAAILSDIQPDDEVILPSYTFVSTANAFALRGAKLIFCDSRKDHPGIDEDLIEALVTPKTKVIVVVHYAGVATDMDKVLAISKKYNLHVIEDAAQAIDSYYRGKPLGTLGHFGTFSFHETKNITCGEGGLLLMNNKDDFKRAEIIWEKGTNRSSFFRGEADKYGWVDIGSSFLPSEFNASVLFAQLENMEKIQNKRKIVWNKYNEFFISMNFDGVQLPTIPEYATNNAHMYYIVLSNANQREKLIAHLKEKGILSVFHYQSLHKSKYFDNKHDGRNLPLSDHYTDCLLRLPLFYDLTEEEQDYILDHIKLFFKS